MNETYQIINCYRQEFPKSRFVGIRYKNSDRVEGMFGYQWSRWFETGRFDILEALLTDEYAAAYADAGAYVGLMKSRCGAPDDYFEYWIGMFLPAGCAVPEGFGHVDFESGQLGVCWVEGKEADVYCREGECCETITDSGMTVVSLQDGGCYMFERYACPRFTAPDENGAIVLDIGFFVE